MLQGVAMNVVGQSGHVLENECSWAQKTQEGDVATHRDLTHWIGQRSRLVSSIKTRF
jgi:hypothetical protein